CTAASVCVRGAGSSGLRSAKASLYEPRKKITWAFKTRKRAAHSGFFWYFAEAASTSCSAASSCPRRISLRIWRIVTSGDTDRWQPQLKNAIARASSKQKQGETLRVGS